jgi:hypothetical protein
MPELQAFPRKPFADDSMFKEKSGGVDSMFKEKSGGVDSMFKEKSGFVDSPFKEKYGAIDSFPKLRRRRCRSLSKAETIVTEEEKIRRAQPDKP